MVLVDKKLMPKTHNELKEWVIQKSRESDYLVKTDVAMDVFNIIEGGQYQSISNQFGPSYHLQLLILCHRI